MKKFFNFLSYAPKRYLAVAATAVAIMVPAMVLAWGPDRPTFTIQNPAPYVAFNSITNNPAHGDERNFMQVKPAGAPNSAYADQINVESGKEYEVFVYFHNNAATSLNASGKGIAQGAYVKAQLPAIVGSDTKSVGFVGANNMGAEPKPGYVWDDVSFKSKSGEMSLSFVPGSAKIYSKGAVDGKTLPDTIVTTGAPLGYDALDGKLPGCEQYSGFVVFRVKTVQPNFTLSKKVAKANTQDPYAEQVAVKPGDKVEYQLLFTNTGDTTIGDVTLKDTLPAGTTYVPGTTKLYNGNYPNGFQLSDNLTKGGVNIGAYTAKANAVVVFTAQVAGNDQLPACGNNKLHNVGRVETPNGSKEDGADVTVDKQCAEASFACTALTVKPIENTNKFKFVAEKDVKNAEFVKFIYVVRNDKGDELYRGEGDTYSQDKPGKYTAQAYLVVKVNGKEQTVTSEACKKPFEIPTTPVNECKPGIPAGDARCKEQPKELPSTGPEAVLGGLFGTSALGFGVHSWLSSRRALRDVINK